MNQPIPKVVDEAGAAAGEARGLDWALAFGQLLAWGAFYYALPVFVAPISRDLGWNREFVFWGLSASLLTAVVVGPWAGREIDRGRGKRVLIGGQALGALCLAGLAVVTTPWLFLLLCCGLGASQGACLYDAAFSLLHRHLGTGAPRAIIRVTLIAGAAGAVFVLGATWLVEALGWRLAAVILGVIELAPLILYWRFVPSDAGWGIRRRVRSGPALAPLRWTPSTAALAVAFGASAATFSTMTIHFLPMMIDRGMSGLAAAQVFAIVGPCQILSRVLVLAPRVGSSLGRYGAAVFMLQCLSVALVCLPGTGAHLILFAVLFGAATGALTIIRGTAPAEVCDPGAIGRLNGAIGAAAGLSRAMAPALFALVSTRYGPMAALTMLLSIAALGTAAFACARLWRIRGLTPATSGS